MDLIDKYDLICPPVAYYKEMYPHMFIVGSNVDNVYALDSATRSTICVSHAQLRRFYDERERSERTPLIYSHIDQAPYERTRGTRASEASPIPFQWDTVGAEQPEVSPIRVRERYGDPVFLSREDLMIRHERTRGPEARGQHGEIYLADNGNLYAIAGLAPTGEAGAERSEAQPEVDFLATARRIIDEDGDAPWT